MNPALAADPWWADPRLIQGGLTLIAAMVAAVAALVVAFFAYPWQKRRDRLASILEERRRAYAEYTTCARRLLFAQPYLDVDPNTEYAKIGDIEQAYYVATDRVWLIAPEAVLPAVHAHHKTMRSIVISGNKSLKGEGCSPTLRELSPVEREQYLAVLNAFRNDIQSHSVKLD